VSGSSASAVLVDGVSQFSVYGQDTLAYVATVDKVAGDDSTRQQEIGIYEHGKPDVIQTASVNQQILIAYNQYEDHEYIAIGATNSTTVNIIRDHTVMVMGSKALNVFAQLKLSNPLQWLSFSSDGRMIVAQSGNQLATYDLEDVHSYNATLSQLGTVTTPFKWFDNFYLWTDTNGKLTIFEFDGTNIHSLVNVSSGYSVLLSGDGQGMLSIGKLGSSNDLQNSALVAPTGK
jgi:hypothetical protein